MDNDRHQAEITAEQDVESDVSKFLWIVIGLFANIIGILIAIVYQPTPPVARLLDKSEEYITFYTDTYKTRARTIQLSYTFIGFIIPAVLSFFFIF